MLEQKGTFYNHIVSLFGSPELPGNILGLEQGVGVHCHAFFFFAFRIFKRYARINNRCCATAVGECHHLERGEGLLVTAKTSCTKMLQGKGMKVCGSTQCLKLRSSVQLAQTSAISLGAPSSSLRLLLVSSFLCRNTIASSPLRVSAVKDGIKTIFHELYPPIAALIVPSTFLS